MPRRDHFRAHARRQVALAASLRVPPAEASHVAWIKDLGLGGALVEPGGPLPPLPVGTHLVLEVTAPTLWDPLAIEGEVAWIGAPERRGRFGVRFRHRGAASLYALFQLLGAHAFDL